MKKTFKEYITQITKKTLDRVMLKDFPNLNTLKIAKFYADGLEWILTFTSGMVMMGTFLWYLPTKYGLKTDKLTIILLCIIIILMKAPKNE